LYRRILIVGILPKKYKAYLEIEHSNVIIIGPQGNRKKTLAKHCITETNLKKLKNEVLEHTMKLITQIINESTFGIIIIANIEEILKLPNNGNLYSTLMNVIQSKKFLQLHFNSQ